MHFCHLPGKKLCTRGNFSKDCFGRSSDFPCRACIQGRPFARDPDGNHVLWDLNGTIFVPLLQVDLRQFDEGSDVDGGEFYSDDDGI